jgi:hypothetical protein
MATKLEEAKNSLEKMKKKEIEVNAKLTILQNFQLSLELEAFSAKINVMLKDNVRLQDLIERKNREIEIQKSSEVDFAEQENSRKKVILRLTSRRDELQQEIASLEERCTDYGLEVDPNEPSDQTDPHQNGASSTIFSLKNKSKCRGASAKATIKTKPTTRVCEAEDGKKPRGSECRLGSAKELRMVS